MSGLSKNPVNEVKIPAHPALGLPPPANRRLVERRNSSADPTYASAPSPGHPALH